MDVYVQKFEIVKYNLKFRNVKIKIPKLRKIESQPILLNLYSNSKYYQLINIFNFKKL